MNTQQHRKESAAIQRRYESKYFAPVAATIQSIVDRTSNIVSAEGVHAAHKWLTNKIENVAMTKIIQQMELEVALRFARREYSSLLVQKRSAKGSGVIFEAKSVDLDINMKQFGYNETWTRFIKNYLYEFIVRKISFDVFQTTKDSIFRVLNDSIEEGWGVDKTVKALDDMTLSETQAARIVRTEITRASNAGIIAAGRTFPYEQNKIWLSAHDDRVRGLKETDHASHVALDGVTVDYEDVFIDPRNGDQLEAPGDPSASAASTINCRCTSALLAKVNDNGRLIPKK